MSEENDLLLMVRFVLEYLQIVERSHESSNLSVEGSVQPRSTEYRLECIPADHFSSS